MNTMQFFESLFWNHASQARIFYSAHLRSYNEELTN